MNGQISGAIGIALIVTTAATASLAETWDVRFAATAVDKTENAFIVDRDSDVFNMAYPGGNAPPGPIPIVLRGAGARETSSRSSSNRAR